MGERKKPRESLKFQELWEFWEDVRIAWILYQSPKQTWARGTFIWFSRLAIQLGQFFYLTREKSNWYEKSEKTCNLRLLLLSKTCSTDERDLVCSYHKVSLEILFKNSYSNGTFELFSLVLSRTKRAKWFSVSPKRLFCGSQMSWRKYEIADRSIDRLHLISSHLSLRLALRLPSGCSM